MRKYRFRPCTARSSTCTRKATPPCGATTPVSRHTCIACPNIITTTRFVNVADASKTSIATRSSGSPNHYARFTVSNSTDTAWSFSDGAAHVAKTHSHTRGCCVASRLQPHGGRHRAKRAHQRGDDDFDVQLVRRGGRRQSRERHEPRANRRIPGDVSTDAAERRDARAGATLD